MDSSNMEVETTSQFPHYADGDVLVIITPVKRFQLHASMLRRNSTTFEHMLVPAAAAQLNARAKRDGVTILYQLELDKTRGGISRFRLNELDSSGRPVRASGLNFLETANGRAPDNDEQYWSWLFATFYNIDPPIDESNMANTLRDCMGLVDVADSVGAINVTRKYTDLALSRHTHNLASSIAHSPLSWVDLGFRLHSTNIFKDAVVHLVGKWKNWTIEEKRGMRTVVRDLCERKFNELQIAKQAIEMRILGHYPSAMTRNALDKPGRPAYVNDIYMWMAVCFFRHWFAQAISDGRNRAAADGGYVFYKSISTGKYLDREDFRNFHQHFPMSSKACGILEHNMDGIKDDLKRFVGDLMADRTSTAQTNPKYEWLTCTVMSPQDFPWSAVKKDDDVHMEQNLPLRQATNDNHNPSLSGSDLTSPDSNLKLGDDN